MKKGQKTPEEVKRKQALSKLGDKNPAKRPDVRLKMSLARLGKEPWNKELKGIHLSPATEFKKGQLADEKHHCWKGNSVGYISLHRWVERKLSRPKKCSQCGSTEKNRYAWANISKEYKRDINDWMRLCYICHKKFDIGNKQKIFDLSNTKRRRIVYV